MFNSSWIESDVCWIEVLRPKIRRSLIPDQAKKDILADFCYRTHKNLTEIMWR